MRSLGLDIGTHCGWAAANEKGDIISGVWNLAPRAHEDSGMRLLKFRASFTDLVATVKPKVIFYEAATFQPGGQGAALVFGQLVGVMMLVAKDAGVPYTGISAASVKKFATGRGNAGKPEMVGAAERRWGKRMTDDEADARWILTFGCSTWGDSPDLGQLFETQQTPAGGDTNGVHSVHRNPDQAKP